jgi:hypothetical protein
MSAAESTGSTVFDSAATRREAKRGIAGRMTGSLLLPTHTMRR